MAERIALHYVARSSPVHRWDPRCKLAGLLCLSALLYYPDPTLLILPSLAFMVVFGCARVPFTVLIQSLRYWIPLLVVFFLVQASFSLSWKGDRLLPASVQWGPLVAAAVNCWRLLLMVLFGVLLTAVTRPRELRDTIIWALRPLPGIPEQRVALMITLTVRFFTIVLDLAAEVAAANRSRLAAGHRSPLRRVKALLLPVFRRSLLRAEDMALALAARGYREDSVRPLRWGKTRGWLPVVGYVLVFVVTACMRR